MLKQVVWFYNTTVLLAWGVGLSFAYDALMEALRARAPPASWVTMQLVKHPLSCLGGLLLSLGFDAIMRGRFSQPTRLLVVAIVLSAVAVRADVQLLSFFVASSSVPASEYSSMLYFNIAADAAGVVLAVLALAKILPYAIPRWYQVLLLGAVSVLMFFDGIMFPASSAPTIYASISSSAMSVEWLRIQWKVYSASAFGVGIYFLTQNVQIATTVAFGLTAYAHLLAWQFGDSVLPRTVLIGNFISSVIGFALNLAATLFDRRLSKKSKK